ncbi:MAG: MerR family transcriptional regulator [Nitrospirota bacterium]
MKIAFSIHEVSRFTGVPAHTIRFWEKDFYLYIRPAKTPGGQRRYCTRDIEIIKRIKRLRYENKYTISGTIDELERTGVRTTSGLLRAEEDNDSKIMPSPNSTDRLVEVGAVES